MTKQIEESDCDIIRGETDHLVLARKHWFELIYVRSITPLGVGLVNLNSTG